MTKRILLASSVAALAIAPGTALAQSALDGVYAAETRVGSPNSIQFQAAQSSLDLTELDFDDFGDTAADTGVDGAGSTEVTGDADVIGGAFTYFEAGALKGERYELRYQRQRRLKEGSRARLLIDLPINIVHARDVYGFGFKLVGGYAVYGTLNVGVEVPVQPNWLVTPRVAYSNAQAGQEFLYDAEQVQASITSRYKLPQVGRGDLTIGNMVGYSHSVNTPLGKQPFYLGTDVWTFRNGIAYQLPMKGRMFGRQSSLRASYVFTYTTGEPFMGFKRLHEAGINFGVRTREAEQKNSFEQMRVGLLYTHGRNEFSGKAHYNSLTLTLGYRF